MVSIELSVAPDDLARIIALQKANHADSVAAELWQSEGFVTMQYTVAQLQAICGPYQHVVAKVDGELVGYALVLLQEHRAAFPILYDMFDKIDAGAFAGQPLRTTPYFVMGQVCIARAMRGQGLFRRLYHALRAQMRADFALCVTEVSTRNGRSMGAHLDVGFAPITLAAPDPSEWRVIAWDWRDA